jgi:hypothetical protein
MSDYRGALNRTAETVREPVPKRLRWYLEREPHALSAVLQILLRVIEAHLRRASDGASSHARASAL